jgi:isocitrate/isopropylmalate dehydrogenase
LYHQPIGIFVLERLRDFCPSDLAVFEPGAKHTFDAAAGKNIANPTAALLAAAKMLQVRIGVRETCVPVP